ncbi:hypothetical protein [Halobiforma nitratireducens]|uniref:Uncharacterized protein n=1 Tax=Halobiforma nitratireducens JCM 10879 TaxID=1227454 RepID=M0MRK9_9EURY|nr:hypothetical protein [Halobiforma nitratireducens]EMA47080.1 hypothetical protein C446_00155 [Halobiforma nitratireducens JCM 10879]
MYERTFGTDWESIADRDRIVRRAFALGVAEELGAEYPGELERLSDEIETAYDRSFVEIAYQKGREKAGNRKSSASADGHVWEELIEEKTAIDPDDQPDGVDLDETMGLPEPLRGIDIGRYQVDSTDRVRRPSFLERGESGRGGAGSRSGGNGGNGDRSPFGHTPGRDRQRRFGSKSDEKDETGRTEDETDDSEGDESASETADSSDSSTADSRE